MKGLYIALVVLVGLGVRVSIYRRRKRRSAAMTSTTDRVAHHAWQSPDWLGDVGTIASREVKERVRGRIFRFGTLIILIVVVLAIIIPKLSHSNGETVQTVGVVGSLSLQAKGVITTAGAVNQDHLRLVSEASLAATDAQLREGKIDVAIVNGDEVLLNEPAGSTKSTADAAFVQDVAEYLGVLKAYQSAGLSSAQAALVTHAKAIPVRSLQSGSKSATQTTSIIGLVLMFIMLSQYCTWILIGVMQEKASRVVEVLLATVRPIQLLGGKVLGIGLVALGQAALVVAFALAVGSAAGSDFLHGAGPVALLCELLWLVVGYGFYCWMYAAAGSMAERQDQVQTLALPLSIPILIGYVYSITVASTGNASLFFKVLAYVPPTAPFCMSMLVSLGDVAWWQFILSVLITLVATVGMATFAARIYRRAVLRTGSRVRVRELFARATHP